MASKYYVIQFTSPLIDETVNRRLFIDTFKEFGQFSKLYLSCEKGFGNVYMQNKEEADNAYQTLKKDNNLRLTLIPPVLKTEIGKFAPVNSSSASMYRDDEVSANANEVMYDIYNNKVNTYTDDNGETYIPLTSLEKSGFKLYPKRRNEDVPEDRYMDTFKNFLMSQANIFMNLNKTQLGGKVVNDTIDNTIKIVLNKSGGRETPNGIPLQRTIQNSPSNYVGGAGGDSQSAPPTHMRRPHMNNTSSPNHGNLNNLQIKTEELELNRNTKVKVQHVMQKQHTSLNCRVELCKNADLIDQIFLDTHTEVNQHILVKNPQLHQICAAKNYGVWSRSCISSLEPISVHFIDMGNSKKIDNAIELRSLSQELCDIPGQSIRVTFCESTPISEIAEGSMLEICAKKQFANGTYLVENNTKPGSAQNTPRPLPETSMRNITVSKPADRGSPNLAFAAVKKENSPVVTPTLVKSIRQEPPSPVLLVPESVRTVETTPKVDVGGVSKMGLMREKMASLRKSVVTSAPPKLAYDPARECILNNATYLGMGYLECTKSIDAESFVAFVFPETAVLIVSELESLDTAVKFELGYEAKNGDTVAVQHFDEAADGIKWVRGFVMDVQAGEYTLALVDYGKVVKTNKICQVPEKYKKVEELACVCVHDKKYTDLFKVKAAFSMEITEKFRANLSLETGDKLSVIFKRWEPALEGTPKPSSPAVQLPVKVAQNVLTSFLPPKTNIKANDMVMLINEHEGSLYLRTKETSAAIKQLIAALSNFNAKQLDSAAIVNQIVLHKCDNELRRAQVISISGNTAMLHYFDYGVRQEAPLGALLYMDPQFSHIEATLHMVKLKGYENGFAVKACEFLRTCFKGKFVVASATPGNIVQLNLNGEDLHAILEKLNKPPYVRLCDLDLIKLPVGETVNLIPMTFNKLSEAIVYFYPIEHDIETFTKVQDLNSHANGEIPLNLNDGQMCIAKFDDEFYRAAVVNFDDRKDQYFVYFMDFGNSSFVSLEDIRVIDDELANINPMAIPCRVKDISDATCGTISEPLLTVLSTHFGAAEPCKANVLSHEADGIYNIAIPELFAEMQGLNLI